MTPVFATPPIHYAFLLAYLEYGPPYDEHTEEDQANLVARRTRELIPVFAGACDP